MAKPSAFNTNVSVNLSELVRARGNLSQPALEAKSGVKQSTIGRVLRGAASPMADTLNALASALECDMELLYLDPLEFSTLLKTQEPLRRHTSAAFGGAGWGGIPVMGEAVASEADLKIDTERPQAPLYLQLAVNKPGVFAIKILGDGLSPAVRDSQFLVIERAESFNPGDLVILEMSDGRQLIREALFERADAIAVDSVKNGQRESISRAQVASMSVVLAVVSASSR